MLHGFLAIPATIAVVLLLKLLSDRQKLYQVKNSASTARRFSHFLEKALTHGRHRESVGTAETVR